MLAQVARVETTVTRSEGEALLLENNFIKAQEPRYNILFRDDKSYPYVCITGEPFPQLRFHRGALDRRIATSARFPSAGAVREGMAHAAEGVPAPHVREHGVREPLAARACCYQIQRCSAPCVGFISEADYREDVQGAALFLQRKTDEVLAQLQAQMEAAAAALEFERAARIRDKISAPAPAPIAAVRRKRDGRRYRRRRGGGGARAGRGQRRDGPRRPACGRSHVLSAACRRRRSAALAEVVPAFLAQHYVERPVPPTIIAAGRRRARGARRGAVRAGGTAVEIVGNPGGERRVWLAMAMQNAEFAIRQKLAQKATQEDRLAALQEALGLAADGAADRMLRRLAHDGRARRSRLA